MKEVLYWFAAIAFVVLLVLLVRVEPARSQEKTCFTVENHLKAADDYSKANDITFKIYKWVNPENALQIVLYVASPDFKDNNILLALIVEGCTIAHPKSGMWVFPAMVNQTMLDNIAGAEVIFDNTPGNFSPQLQSF